VWLGWQRGALRKGDALVLSTYTILWKNTGDEIAGVTEERDGQAEACPTSEVAGRVVGRYKRFKMNEIDNLEGLWLKKITPVNAPARRIPRAPEFALGDRKALYLCLRWRTS
jgi:hypothetical protein